ncbi:MAG: Rrf2 family transcriptional regulator [Acidimicrobiia bacterium]|nr:Rrf2 family transcriptional regulator [Acidimicrobiia bacterium]
MKLSAQEEYGLRCLLHLARSPAAGSLTIAEISRAEGLSVPNVAKLMRLLRMGGLVKSVRGQAGGYRLARPSQEIMVGDVIELLGGQLFGPEFCDRHTGLQATCSHAVDCSLRVLWTTIQEALDQVLAKVTLKDLLCSEQQMQEFLTGPAAPARIPPVGPSTI